MAAKNNCRDDFSAIICERRTIVTEIDEMTDWNKVEAILDVALGLPPAARESYLDERCAGDAELRAEVVSLLAGQDGAADFLETPVAQLAAGVLPAEAAPSLAGRRIGAYKIIREIGRGGMGAVYLALRSDDQFNKRVAIKLLRRGMDSEDILRRFRNEERILAALEHPNIGRLLDAGINQDDGLPYFVMEYIEGEPLDKYCEERKLDTAARLQLFRKVCSAVQYAHQNLIVHRDLKPSNILVTAQGEPKLLDFGIAKLLNPELSSHTIAPTATFVRLMTPDYASPEQIRGKTITTASDIYSLGILLYKLLTGQLPYHFEDASPQEIERVVCETEPARPSLAIARGKGVGEKGSGGEKDASGKGNSYSPSPLLLFSPSALRGDLDNIILMALRKEPERRYRSAEHFSQDLERYLQGLPVAARPNTFRYRTAKFVVRNRFGVAAAALVTVSLVVGIIATLWQARVARQERARAEEIKTFLERTLNYSNPGLTGKNVKETTVTEVLDEAARRLEGGEFANQPEVKAELEYIIARTYYGQGRYDPARRMMQKYVTLQTQLYGEYHPKTLLASQAWAAMLFEKNEMGEAEKIYRRILPLMRDELRKGNIKAEEVAVTLNNFSYLRRTQGDSREAEALFREALALSPQLSPEEWNNANGATRSLLASTLADQGRFDEALQASREAVSEYRQRGQTDTASYGFALNVLGGFLTEKGDFGEADAELREGEAGIRKFFAPTTLWLGDNLRNQGVSLYFQGKHDEALGKMAEAQKIYLESFGKHYDHYPTVLLIQGLSLTKKGSPQAGEKLLREALQLRTESLPAGHFWTALAQSALGECLTIQGRFAEAEPLVVQSYETLKANQGANNPKTNLARQRVLTLYEKWHKPDRAAQYRP